MLTAIDVARYFLAIQDEDAGELISNLKVQKLCYYAQGFHLAMYETPLFQESIEAWEHGPVTESLWREYRDYGSGPIEVPEIDLSRYPEDIQDLLDEVYEVYGQYSAWKLRNMTHGEEPWIRARGRIITKQSMQDFFKDLLTDDDEEEEA